MVGISETRSVCYSAERSSKKEKRGDGPLSQDTIEKILGILKITLESCTAAVYSRIREGIYVVEDALKRKLNKQRADLLQHQKTQATSIHMLGSSSPILSGRQQLFLVYAPKIVCICILYYICIERYAEFRIIHVCVLFSLAVFLRVMNTLGSPLYILGSS